MLFDYHLDKHSQWFQFDSIQCIGKVPLAGLLQNVNLEIRGWQIYTFYFFSHDFSYCFSPRQDSLQP